MKRYPHVPDEFTTLQGLLKSGNSLARYGDGEFKIACGTGCVSQGKDSDLTERMRAILRDPPAGLTVAIPRIAGRYDMRLYSPDLHEFWTRISNTRHYIDLLADGVKYGSSFITRVDNAPHINCAQYWDGVQRLFDGCDVVVVSGQFKEATKQILARAKSHEHMAVPARDAFKEYADIKAACMRYGSEKTFYLSCGPTATILAADLCAAGWRALDMGAMHRFWLGGKHGRAVQ